VLVICEPVVVTLWRSPVFAAAAGAVSWTAAEYGLHRFAMHELRGKGLASREHLSHHADVTYFSPASKKLASAAGTTAVAFPLATALAGRRWATAFTVGMIGTYFGYEVAHRRVHTHPPRNAYGRWARRSHLHHHFGAPMRNFGVTSPVWDKVMGTYDDPGVITVPRRMAPVWMLDETGQVRPELAADYRVKGGARIDRARAEADRIDAFANAAPEA
jgi:sterol desaturase/sphingolipid hydroxylase (fatty acid hydroxylase superfamily)